LCVFYASKRLRALLYQNHAHLPSVVFAVGDFPSIRDFRRSNRRGIYVGVSPRSTRVKTRVKILLTAKIAGDALAWIKKRPPRSTFKLLFLETKTLLIPIMSTGSAKSPAEGLKNSECEWGVITTRPSIPYVAEVDPYEKPEKTKIKAKLTNGTDYWMAPFRLGTNKDYICHIIAMIRLVEQLGLEKSVEEAHRALKEVEDKLGPLNKKINMCKVRQEKEALEKLLEQAEKLTEKNRKSFWKEIVRAYELIRTYFVGEARTQWDKTVIEMHNKGRSGRVSQHRTSREGLGFPPGLH
jgi:hypothetical protein